MYITREDVAAAVSLAELVQLSNDEGYGEPDWQIVDRAIAYACELADGYLMGRYTLPLEPAPTVLRPLCTDIARHWLHRRRINGADFPKSLEDAYKNALKVLTMIRDGEIQIGTRPQNGDGATERVQSESGAYQFRTRDRQDWSGY